MNERVDHFVYVMAEAAVDGSYALPTKIGITRNVGARLAAVQTGSARPLGVVYAFWVPSREAALAIEAVLHEALAPNRMHGEWFDIDPLDAVECASSSVAAWLATQTNPLIISRVERSLEQVRP